MATERKKEHLEAGKRRLEEFRKKKAADRAKKATPNVQAQPAEDNLNEKQPSESENIRLADSNGAEAAISDSSNGVLNNKIKANEYHSKADDGSSSFYGHNNNNIYPPSVDKVQTHENDLGFRPYDKFNSHETKNDYNFGTLGGLTNGFATERDSAFQHSFNNVYTSSFASHDITSNADSVHRSSPSLWSTESRSLGFGQPNHVAPAGIIANRTRPSFLDSITTSSVSTVSVPLTKSENTDPFGSKAHQINGGDSLNSTNSKVPAENGHDLFRYGMSGHSVEMNHNFHSRKVDEDFAALEQHIEDLTQEKFSLQRTLEASRALAESLAAENSALTDSYNQQGSAVQQLKLDMAMLQEEIKARLVELESMRIGYTNAQMECNAADERAKLLASEVIGLEEKALRLRSSELKLERQLENLQTEVSSSKKKISSLEKERKDLQLTIDAMQEEKKMLQSMLRKASTSSKSVDISKNSNEKKDASTSTQDLAEVDDRNSTSDSSNLEIQASSTQISQTENIDISLESPLDIPPDQLRTIQNINTLIFELLLEKEELMKALSTESSQSSRLKDLNMELSRKLEIQTQRLELLTAQNMSNGNIPQPRQADSRPVHESIAYADEGDEVVERVLGWIMKLFPGGPSKRRTSKLI